MLNVKKQTLVLTFLCSNRVSVISELFIIIIMELFRDDTFTLFYRLIIILVNLEICELNQRQLVRAAGVSCNKFCAV